MKHHEPVSISDLLRRISTKLRQQADQLAVDNGLSAQQARTVTYIANHEAHGVIQKDLADISGRRSASITHMIKDLEAKGFITRQTQVDDERRKQLSATPKGRQIAQDYKEIMAAFDDRLLSNLTKTEQGQLQQLLNKVDAQL